MDDKLKVDIGKLFKNYLTFANPLSSIFATDRNLRDAPTNTLRLSKRDDLNYALWNTLGTLSWLVPVIGAGTYIANKRRHDKLKETIDKGVTSHIGSDFPILSPNSDVTNTRAVERSGDELRQIKQFVKSIPKYIPKIAAGPVETGKDIALSSVFRSLPLLATPLAAVLTTLGVQEYQKKKYREELEDETRKIQAMQDAMDMDTLKQLGYIVKDTKRVGNAPKLEEVTTAEMNDVLRKATGEPLAKAANMYKAAEKDEDSGSLTDDMASGAKALFAHLPIAALILLTGGTAFYGTNWLLKRQNAARKLKFLEEKALGRNRALKGPELILELPEGYKENFDKKQTQIIPGIDSAPVVEDAQIVENPKKDVFLG